MSRDSGECGSGRLASSSHCASQLGVIDPTKAEVSARLERTLTD
jgi:hypothetical protein